jgi:uncharacterized repeat protein (TIGR02543 family)
MSIGKEAFNCCLSLTSITIPNKVMDIGRGTFASCQSLTEIIVDNSNMHYASVDGVLFNKNRTLLIIYPAGKTDSSYAIPSNVTSIVDLAFIGCEFLSSVTIPDSVTYIGDSAFESCGTLTSVTIPSSVKSIGHYAFSDCTSLTSVVIPSSVKNIGKRAFARCPKLKLKVYKNSYAQKYAKKNKILYTLIKAKSYKATFNANKGKVSGKKKLVKSMKTNSKLGKLPTSKRNGYKFKGWYTKKSGGEKIKSSTKMPAKNVTYYAHWKKR